MVIAALVVGLLVAYYFGVRPGALAASVTAILFTVAMVMPSVALYAYGAVGVGVVLVLLAGPRFGRPGAPRQLLAFGTLQLKRASRMMSRGKSPR